MYTILVLNTISRIIIITTTTDLPAENRGHSRRDYAHGQRIDSRGKGIALLSFDGGPFGGLSSLYVLKRFMERLAEIQGLPQAPKPCEFFDMITGLGVGGQVNTPSSLSG